MLEPGANLGKPHTENSPECGSPWTYGLCLQEAGGFFGGDPVSVGSQESWLEKRLGPQPKKKGLFFAWLVESKKGTPKKQKQHKKAKRGANSGEDNRSSRENP